MVNRSYRIGYNFQRRVKKQLEKEGWFVLTQPKSAFPDMICWRKYPRKEYYDVVGVECKVKKYLDRSEKARANELLKKGYVRELKVAYRVGRKLLFYNFKVGD